MKSFPKLALLGVLLTSCLFAKPTPTPSAKDAATKSKSLLNCVMTPHIMRLFLQQHMTEKSITPEIQKRTVKSFLESVDGMKLYLTKAEYSAQEAKIKDMFNTMRKGDCSALESVRQLLEMRSKEHYTYVQKLLGESFKFDETVELVTNPKKREFSSSIEELNKFLEKYVMVQLARYLAADKSLKDSKELLVKSYLRNSNKLRDLQTSDMLDIFINAFSTSLDPHSTYFSPKADQEFGIEMTNSLEGIGASLRWEDGFTVVNEVIVGGPADMQKKLIRDDKILAVAQGEVEEGKKGEDRYVPIVDMDLSDVVQLIRGTAGSKVSLRIQRKVDGKNVIIVEIIKRGKVSVKETMARIKYVERKHAEKSQNLAVITLPSFYAGEQGAKRSAYNDVKRLLEEANAKKVDGIVLDLSNNGGGLLSDAVSIAGLFIKEGGVVASKFTGGETEVLDDKDPSVIFSGPLVLLTNRYSASASEIVAGALKDYKRALVVGGDHTFGKGTVQNLAQLPEGLGALKFTISMFYLPSGQSTQHKGVDSDIVIPSPFNSDEIGEKAMDYSFPPSAVKPFMGKNVNVAIGKPEHWFPVNSTWIKELATKSQSRVKTKAEFKDIFKQIEDSKKNDDLIKVKEFLAKSKENEKKDKKDLHKRQVDILEEMSRPYVDEALDILSDLVSIEAPLKEASRS